MYNSGEKRYEIRHLNDLRLAHPESLTAEAVRPKLGRPRTSVQPAVQNTTDANQTGSRSNDATQTGLPSSPSTTVPFPKPPAESLPGENKQTYSTQRVPPNATSQTENHETSNPNRRVPASNVRPVRATRNPNPHYIEAYQWSSHRPWSASPQEIAALNASIGG